SRLVRTTQAATQQGGVLLGPGGLGVPVPNGSDGRVALVGLPTGVPGPFRWSRSDADRELPERTAHGDAAAAIRALQRALRPPCSAEAEGPLVVSAGAWPCASPQQARTRAARRIAFSRATPEERAEF